MVQAADVGHDYEIPGPVAAGESEFVKKKSDLNLNTSLWVT